MLTIPLFLGGPGQIVLPTFIWFTINNGQQQMAAAITTILILIITVIYTGIHYFTDLEVTSI